MYGLINIPSFLQTLIKVVIQNIQEQKIIEAADNTLVKAYQKYSQVKHVYLKGLRTNGAQDFQDNLSWFIRYLAIIEIFMQDFPSQKGFHSKLFPYRFCSNCNTINLHINEAKNLLLGSSTSTNIYTKMRSVRASVCNFLPKSNF